MDEPTPIETLPSQDSCLECDRPWLDLAERWRVYISEDRELLLYCPSCASREFDS